MWSWLRVHLAPYLRMQRIENMAGTGTPDIFFAGAQHSGWLELKYRATLPRRRVTPIFSDATGIRPTQLAWYDRFAAANVHIILRAEYQLWCVPAALARKINGADSAALGDISAAHFPSIRALRSADWSILEHTLLRLEP